MNFARFKHHVLKRNFALILIVLGIVAFGCGFLYSAFAVDFTPPQNLSPDAARAFSARVAATSQVQYDLYNWGRFFLGAGLGIGVLQTVARVFSGSRRKA